MSLILKITLFLSQFVYFKLHIGKKIYLQHEFNL